MVDDVPPPPSPPCTCGKNLELPPTPPMEGHETPFMSGKTLPHITLFCLLIVNIKIQIFKSGGPSM